MASDDQMWQPPIGLATTGIVRPIAVGDLPPHPPSATGCTCGGWYVGDFPPPPCAMHAWPAWHDARPLTYQPIAAPVAPLSDADVERIARRVAELLKATP